MIKKLGFVFAVVFALSEISVNAQFDSSQFEDIKGVEVDLIKSHTEGELQGFNTYRVYAVMKNEGDMIMAVFGQEEYPLYVITDGQFFQHSRGAALTDKINRHLLTEMEDVHPLLKYDSWVTIGYEDHYHNNIQSWTLNLEDFENTTNVADSIYVTDGAWWVGAGDPKSDKSEWLSDEFNIQGKAGPSKRILLMQLTTNGNIEGLVNVQGFTKVLEIVMEPDNNIELTRNPIRSFGLRFNAP